MLLVLPYNICIKFGFNLCVSVSKQDYTYSFCGNCKLMLDFLEFGLKIKNCVDHFSNE